MDCGVGPCKKYDRYEYPAGFPEEMKRRLEGIKPSDGVTSSLTESALVRAYREAVIHETKLEAEVQRLQKSERNMDHKVTQLVAEAEAKRLSRGYVDAERRVNVTHEVTQLRAELEDAKILKLAREEEVARANGRHRSPLFQTGHFNLHSGGSSNRRRSRRLTTGKPESVAMSTRSTSPVLPASIGT
jgi:molybdopterin-biosynthesis enzyme MoeA-like protein